MKTAWRELDGRLGKQEMFRENFVRESIAEKSQRSVDKLLRLGLCGTIMIILTIPFLLWFLSILPDGVPPLYIVFFQFMLVICTLLIPSGLYYAWVLFRVDMLGNVHDNIKLINRYKVQLHYTKRIGFWILYPIMFVWTVAIYAKLNATPWLWAFMGGMWVVTIVWCIYVQKKVVAKHIGQITRGLEELRDLKEDKE